jgi:polysaccharide pyruvyl transferase WcaK-like protein
VLFGLFGIGNLGNESTLWVTLHQLRRRLPEAEVTCVCDGLPAFAKDFRLSRLPFDPLPLRGARLLPMRILQHAYLAMATLVTEPLRRLRAARMLAGADQLVVVGTGALDDLGEFPWGMPAWILRWTRAARRSRATVHLLAVGAGPIRSAINRLLMTRAVANAQIRSYRDDYSREYMARLGVSSQTDQVVPDLVFAWPRESLPAWRPANDPPKVIGVGVMAYFGWNVGEARGQEIYAEYVGKMAAFVRGLLEAGYAVRLLVGERGTDSRAVRDVFKAVGAVDAPERLAAPQIESANDVLREIMMTDLVVASRFHNLVLALLLARPVVSVGYSAKFEALMQEMNLDRYCQSIETLDVERLHQQVRDLAAGHADAVSTIVSKSTEYRERLERLYDSTFGVAPAVPRSVSMQ